MSASLRSRMGARFWRFSDVPRPPGTWVACVFAAVVVASIPGSVALGGPGMLETIREDVRGDTPAGPASSPSSDGPADNSGDEPGGFDWNNCQSETNGGGAGGTGGGPTFLDCVLGAGALAAAPVLIPHNLLGDDFSDPGGFHAFPYDGLPCYGAVGGGPRGTRRFAVRLDVDYLDTFNRVDSLNGRLLVETAPRFGIDASWDRFEERLRTGGRDHLQLGDCNLVYRFAQSDWAEFRAGLGVNWMGDCSGADLGFNFTYGADFYPRKPWCLSSTVQCGTLGHAGLLRFRTTAGIVFHGVEPYAGYEYTDIGRTHWNALVAGLRFRF